MPSSPREATSPSPRARPARLGGRYRIEQRLGSGSFGTVYRAHDEMAGRQVALKILRAPRREPSDRLRMQDEFRVIAALEHPQIARAFDFGYSEGDDVPFYTREYVAGVPLPPGPPRAEEPRTFLAPILDLLEALHYVHEHGVLHLDIHAGNLIVADDERRGSVLIDSGFVPDLETVSTGDARSRSLPPELSSGGPLSARTDLYLAGRLLQYRLTGSAGGRPELPREIPGWGTRLTLELERIAEKALQADPDERFRTALEFRDALSRAIGTTATRARLVDVRPRVVGRDAELAVLDRAIEEATSGAAGLVWWVGPPGSGKSRLLAEARVRSQLRGLPTVEVAFTDQPAPEPALWAALRRSQPGRRERIAWLEPLSPGFGGTPSERAGRAAGAYFESSGPPLVLLLDDLDAADHESRLLADALVLEAMGRREASGATRGLGLFVTTSTKPSIEGKRIPAGRWLRPLAPLPARAGRQLLLALLGSLDAPESFVRKAVALGRGSPLCLRQLAASIREEWRHRRSIPASAALPDAVPARRGAFPEWSRLPAGDRKALEALAVIGRPIGVDEVAAALALPAAEASSSLRRLARLGIIEWRGASGRRRCHLARPETASLAAKLPRGRAREIHQRLVALLRRKAVMTGVEREHLTRHLLAAGCPREALDAGMEAARFLRSAGSAHRAVRLLEEIGARGGKLHRILVAEELSSILEEIGDHARGARALEPLWNRRGEWSRATRVRLGRRLGVHHHRAGDPVRALQVFEETRGLADLARDKEELILVDSELAELHIFQGKLGDAETACRQGLERIGSFEGPTDFRGRMEVMLRASLGHIALRRLDLDAARRELERALDLSRRYGTLGDRAAILHNLGITENYACDFPRARRYFLEAERLLVRAGERTSLIKISTNLLLIAAKLGDRKAAEAHRDRVDDLLRHHPGKRLECFSAYSKGLSGLLLGHCDEGARELRKAVTLARELGDEALRSFAELSLAECLIFMGDHARSLRILRALALRPAAQAPASLERMALSRLYAVEALLGSTGRARRALDRLDSLPRSEIAYAELWNDLWTALGHLVSGTGRAGDLERTRRGFERLRIPLGERLARLLCLLDALRSGDPRDIEAHLPSPERAPWQRFLQVAEPVAAGCVSLAAGDLDRAEAWAAAASSAICGSAFLEIDWALELLRARVASRRGDLREARRHLHRSLHLRDHLLQLAPAGMRERFGSHSRFAELRKLEARLGLSATPGNRAARRERSLVFEKIIGRAPAMIAVFETIERLHDQEIPVLITGETGTGKDLLARAVHARSPRRSAPLRVVTCACLPPELFESELFGHVAGAFTGADRDHAGILEDAHGGTLLLDEVGQLPLESQAKLLGVLDSGSIRKLGSSSPRAVDVRFLSTTAVDLDQAVQSGRFRRDLYHRLAGLVIHAPPLRDRIEDIPHLARHLLEAHARRLDRPVPTLDEDAIEVLARHDWPGNVRELEALLLRASIQLSRAGRLAAAAIEALLHRDGPAAAGSSISGIGFGTNLTARSLDERRRELEREYLTRIFRESRGDLRAMMRALRVKSSKLYAWLRELGLDIRELRKGLE